MLPLEKNIQMVKYTIETAEPGQHVLKITMSFTARDNATKLQMPYWRPGRYEAGNFSKNIFRFEAFADDNAIASRKLNGNTWKLDTESGTEVKVVYRCYASELTAGNTYYDADLLLVNPVNCLMYVLGMEHEPGQVRLAIPDNWKVATAMKPLENGAGIAFTCSDVQQLLDTPILASEKIQTLDYKVGGVKFYIDIYGEGLPDLNKFKQDFVDFTQTQISAFGSFPVSDYRFLTLLLPHKAYHGVEHESSTVVIMGPSTQLDRWSLYKELVGVSSHELYHTWNVKSLRPAEWTPYDFTGPGFSRLGYVAEGVTTYMGDWMLWQSGFFSDTAFISELSTHMQRHLDNEGRFNLSLADSSVDTWVDGYGGAQPRRRVSIYVEGALLALVCDIELMKATKGERCLSDVMRILYQKYGALKGFNEDQYWDELQNAADINWSKLRQEVVDGCGNLQKYVEDALAEMDLRLSAKASAKTWESQWGVRFVRLNGDWTVVNVLSGSPAEKAGIWFGDQLTEIAGRLPDAFFEGTDTTDLEGVTLSLRTGFKTKTAAPEADGVIWMKKYEVVQDHDSDQLLFNTWKSFLKKQDLSSDSD